MQVNCYRCRHSQGAKGAVRLQPKGQCSRMFLRRRGTRGQERLSAYEAGTSSFVLVTWNRINPPSRLRKAGIIARCADGMTGRGCGKKRRPFRNGTDRSCKITPPCKWADFLRVMDDEIARRTFTGGKANEHG